jgi:hypothetical protein
MRWLLVLRAVLNAIQVPTLVSVVICCPRVLPGMPCDCRCYVVCLSVRRCAHQLAGFDYVIGVKKAFVQDEIRQVDEFVDTRECKCVLDNQ